jgi:hypothetical protein
MGFVSFRCFRTALTLERECLGKNQEGPPFFQLYQLPHKAKTTFPCVSFPSFFCVKKLDFDLRVVKLI